jgi:menaquinone-dependent protoporphyrinogen IX oxidase
VPEAIAMSISVGQTRKHGATGEMAERIAEVLSSAGQRAETRPVQHVDDLGGYQRFGIARQVTRLGAPGGQEAPR